MKKLTYKLGLPEATGPHEVVGLDFEIFETDVEHLHLAKGTFACLSVATAAGNWLVTDSRDVKRVMARVHRSVLAMQHGHYDLRYFAKFGVDIERLRVWDVEVAAHVLWSGYYDHYSLADLARRELGVFLDKAPREGFAEGVHELTAVERDYAVRDSVVTREIALLQQAQMDEATTRLYWEIEFPAYRLIPKLDPMRLDRKLWLSLADNAAQEAEGITQRLGFNPRSHQVVKNKLAELGIVVPNTQADTLAAYTNFRLVADVIRARECLVNSSTYGEGWLRHVSDDDLVEGDWRQCGTETDRWACQRPNLQNVPVRKVPRYRNCFLSPIRGEVVISTDADQQEPRCAAHLTQDRALLSILRSGTSSHVGIGRLIWGDPNFSKKSEKYWLAKIINLGILYGQSAYGLSATAQVPVEEAEGFIARYFEKLPGVARWQGETRASALALGYVRGATGMQMWINPHANQWPRNAVNWPVQQTAAHITKRMVAHLWDDTQAAGLPFGLMALVHDEAVIHSPRKWARQYQKIAETAWIKAAEDVIPGTPFAAETHIGPTWSKKDD